MSADSNSASGNSWTLLTPEQTGVQDVGPAVESNKTEGHPAGSTEVHTDLVKISTEPSAPEQCDPAHGKESEDTKEIHSPEPHQVKPPETGEDRAQLNALEDITSVEDLSSWTPDHEEQDALTGHSESPDSPGTDADSFSDSYTHISPTSASSTHPGREESHLKKTRTEGSKSGVELPENKEKEGDGLRKRKVTHLGSLDQRKKDAEDDDEGEEEEFQLPQREEEKVFSLNKCILAALILLGLGTIFFSGVLMDPDDEGDIDVRDLKDKANKEWLNPEVSRDTPVSPEPPDMFNKQETDSDEQILILHAQLQQHQGELKAVQHLAEEGEKERAKREEIEKDYQRIKEELERLPALQKELEQENERMKDESEKAKKELEALPSLHRELEHLRAQVSQLTQSTEKVGHAHPVASSGMPSSGNIRDVPPIEPQDRKHMKHWDKKSTEREPSGEEKEGKKKKSGKKDGKEKRERVTEEEHVKEQKYLKKDKSKPEEEKKSGKSKEWRDEKEWKKDKRRDDEKVGKGDEGKKALKDLDEKKGWKEEKKWKKDKHEEQDEHRRDKKDWKDAGKKKVKDDKEKERKDRGEKKDWKEDKEWKTDKQSDRKEKKKEWKEKDEWKGVKEGKKGKSEDKFNDKTEKKWKGGEKEFHRFDEKEMEKNHWRGKEREWSTDEDWKKDKLKDNKQSKAYHRKHEEKKTHTKTEKGNKDEKERSNKEKYRDSHQRSSHHYNEHQKQHHEINPENYWPRQRQKIQHNHRQKETCSGVTECAAIEGLSPVSLQDFEILLQSYLKKIQFPEDQTSEKEEFSKLVREFFTDGVFVHDRMPFSEFVEDVADILEDMADGEESDLEESEEDDDDDDDEMEALEREAMEMFALPEEAGKKESRKVRG